MPAIIRQVWNYLWRRWGATGWSKGAGDLAGWNPRLAAQLDQMDQVAVLATNLHGTITHFNAGAEHLLGYPREQMVGVRTVAGIGPRWELAERNGPGQGCEFQRTYRREDGAWVNVSLAVSAIRTSSGRVYGYLAVASAPTSHPPRRDRRLGD